MLREGNREVVRLPEREAASILTTDGLMRSATSAKLTTPENEAGRGRSFTTSCTGAVETTGVCDTPPATMMPTRNATDAASANEMNVKRFDMDGNVGPAAPRTLLLSPGMPLPSGF